MMANSSPIKSATFLYFISIIFEDKVHLASQALKSPIRLDGASQMRSGWEVGSEDEPEPATDGIKKPIEALPKKVKKKPYGSFEVESGSCKHDVDGVPEETLVEVAAEAVVRLAVPDDRLNPRPLAEQLVLFVFNILWISCFWYVWNHDIGVARLLLSPIVKNGANPPSLNAKNRSRKGSRKPEKGLKNGASLFKPPQTAPKTEQIRSLPTERETLEWESDGKRSKSVQFWNPTGWKRAKDGANPFTFVLLTLPPYQNAALWQERQKWTGLLRFSLSSSPLGHKTERTCSVFRRSFPPTSPSRSGVNGFAPFFGVVLGVLNGLAPFFWTLFRLLRTLLNGF